ncbi:MAG: hypothetical protein KGH72_03580 [Candidatus Micrarchaeota archaeon]|nr:hypothetical protein [Candidatus Micrarchaeota archaeon]
MSILKRGAFGDSGRRITLEERLYGNELSYIVITDGTNVRALAPTRDYKARYDGDKGPKTGGMGSYSPAELNEEEDSEIRRRIVEPTLRGLKKDGIDYSGALYFGLMKTSVGFKVIEYNVRLGDPETQTQLFRMRSDLVPYLHSAANGNLAHLPEIKWDRRKGVSVVVVSPGYPDNTQTIRFAYDFGELGSIPHLGVFYGGLKEVGTGFEGRGRMLTLSILGYNFTDANIILYRGFLSRLDFGEWRGDIGLRPSLVERGRI